MPTPITAMRLPAEVVRLLDRMAARDGTTRTAQVVRLVLEAGQKESVYTETGQRVTLDSVDTGE